MRGDNDANLNWPFSSKINLRLIDQSTTDINKQCNISHSFFPNIQSTCFRRPNSNMNEAYGIKNFVTITRFQENFCLYVKNNTMFIEVKADSLSEQTGKISYTKIC